MPRPRLRAIFGALPRKRWLAGISLIVTVGALVAILAGANSSPSTSAAGDATTGSGAATVQRRDLVETDTESGTLSFSDPQTVYDRLNGTITWLPRIGQVIKPGGTIYDVGGEPVLLMNGSTPAYRTLSPDAGDGPDVLELNRNLIALGFDAGEIVADDIWQPATTVGVELLQESLGEPQTGTLSLGKVVFLPGPQLVSTVDASLGGTGGAAGSAGAGAGSGGSSSASTGLRTPRPEFVSLTPGAPAGACLTTTGPATTGPTATVTTGPPPSATTQCPASAPTSRVRPGVKRPGAMRPRHPTGSGQQQTLAALTSLLRAEEAQLTADAARLKAQRAPSSSSSSHGGTPGDSGATAQAVLQTTSTHLVVTVDLSASSQREAGVGEHVGVEMPSGRTVGGRITAVSSVAQSSGSSGGGSGSGSGDNGSGGSAGGSSGPSASTIPVTIALSGHHTGAGLDQAAVSVNFVQQRARQVLSVPVTALLATGGGNYAVQEAQAPRRLLRVTTGLFAAGDVQISGAGIYSGLQVSDSQG